MRPIALGFVAAALLASISAHAGAPGVNEVLKVELPAQLMQRSLDELNLIFPSYSLLRPDEDVERLTAPALNDRVNIFVALDRLLTGSGYTYQVEEGTRNIVLARESPAPAATVSSEITRQPLVKDQPSAPPIVVVRQPLIETTSTENREPSFQWVQTIGLEEIKWSGAATVGELLKSRITNRSAQTRGGANYDTSAFALRGLETAQTLVLINGHRPPPFVINGVSQQPNIDAIPLSIVDHIELGSPAYAASLGGGAVAVINVVYRPNLSNAESSIFYGMASDQSTTSRGADIRFGASWAEDKASFQLAAHVSKETPLLAEDRDYLSRARRMIAANNPQSFVNGTPPNSSTANISADWIVNPMTGERYRPALTTKSGLELQSFRTSVPYGYAGPALDGGAALAANADHWNLSSSPTAQIGGGGKEPLTTGRALKSVIANLSREMANGIRVDVELLSSASKGFAPENGADSTYRLSPSSPANPFNQTIVVTVPAIGADTATMAKLMSWMVAAGVSRRFGKWAGKLEYVNGESRYQYSTAGSLLSGATSAVESGLINVLADPSTWTTDFSSYASDPIWSSPVRAQIGDLTVRLDGPLATLPTGVASIQLALEHRHDRFGGAAGAGTTVGVDAVSGLSNVAGDYGLDGAFINLSVPLMRSNDSAARAPKMEVQLGVRYDRHTVEASGMVDTADGAENVRSRRNLRSTTPIAQFNYRITSDFLLRVSYSQVALPLSADQIIPSSAQTLGQESAAILGLRDPLRGNEPLGSFKLLTGGNPDLDAQRYESWSVGLTTDPLNLRSWNIDVDWTHIHEKNGIGSFPISQENLERPSLVTRAAAGEGDSYAVGAPTEYRGNLLNVTSRRIETLDLSLNLKAATSHFGSFGFFSRATWFLRDNVQALPGAPHEDRLGLINSPRWNALAGLTWQGGRFDLQWMTNYYSGYFLNSARTVDQSLGVAKLDMQIYHNASLGYRFGHANMRLRVMNAFDKETPIGLSTSPFYSFWGDARGRSYWVTLSTDLSTGGYAASRPHNRNISMGSSYKGTL